MTDNDLKNRISFALKDATLQQGFEIICKRIAELEKENADLKAEIGLNEATIQEQLEDRVKVIKENEDLKKEIECYKSLESHFDEIEEDAKAIAKENAELKVQIEQMKCCGNCKNFNRDFDLCFFSGGDKDYHCRNRRWEFTE